MSINSIRWAGIGSRATPYSVQLVMEQFAKFMASKGHELATGGAEGADSAFMNGAAQRPNSAAQIHLPWPSYKCPALGGVPESWRIYSTVGPEAFELAAKYHPAWTRCKQGARALHARNGYIVLGRDLNTPVKFVVAWTQDGTGQGGTGQGLRIAQAWSIPILDLGKFTEIEDMKQALNQAYQENK